MMEYAHMFRLPTAEARTLRLLGNLKSLTLTDISKYNGVHITTEEKRLKNMANKGLIIYESQTHNKTRISLSQHGRRILNAMETRK